MYKFKIWGYQLGKSQPQANIQGFFDENLKGLRDQKLKMADEISEWEDMNVRQIREHAHKGKSLLEKEYEKRVRYINKICQHFVDTLLVYEEQNNTKEIDGLINQCEALKFELAAHENYKQTVHFIKVTTQEAEPADIKENKINDDDETDIYKGIHADPSARTTFANAQQTK
jgi:hypothetical protein